MTIGSYREKNERVEQAEALGFDRRHEPLRWNDHQIVFMQNDAHQHYENYRYHFSVICVNCNTEKICRGTTRDSSHIVTAKLLVLGPFWLDECE